MAKIKYMLQYLPTFYNDLEEHVMYISHVLKTVQAANELLNDVENAILDRLPVAESFEPYHSRKKRENPYYRIYVKNYVIYYVVIPNGRNVNILSSSACKQKVHLGAKIARSLYSFWTIGHWNCKSEY